MRQFSSRRNTRGARGITLPLLAIFIVVLFVIASLAVDLGILYTARTSAQHTADAAALAGAWVFANSPGAAPDQMIANVQDAAITAAAQNKILGKAVTITASDVNVDVSNQRITVTVPTTNAASDIGLYFARLGGFMSSNVAARATAEAGPTAGGSSCVKPIFLPNTILSNLDPLPACDASPKEVIFVPGPGNEHPLSSWYTDIKEPALYGSYTVTSVSQITTAPAQNIRPIRPSESLVPSDYYSIDFGELLNTSSGASTYRCTLGQCLDDCSSSPISIQSLCNQDLPLETGNMVGPTHLGVQTLLGDSPQTFGGRLNDQFFYLTPPPGSMPVYDSGQVALVPVWDNCTQTITPGYHGQKVKIIGFVSMFIKGWDNTGQQIQAYFLGASPCNAAGTPGGAVQAAQPVPVRLIQNP